MIMKHKKIMNLLDNAPDQPSKFRANNWVEKNDEWHGTYNTNSQIEFKTLILKSILCYYSDACTLVSGTITVVGAGPDDAAKVCDAIREQI